jgi:hypothetical protein
MLQIVRKLEYSYSNNSNWYKISMACSIARCASMQVRGHTETGTTTCVSHSHGTSLPLQWLRSTPPPQQVQEALLLSERIVRQRVERRERALLRAALAAWLQRR